MRKKTFWKKTWNQKKAKATIGCRYKNIKEGAKLKWKHYSPNYVTSVFHSCLSSNQNVSQKVIKASNVLPIL